ncbi:MAG: TIR domain-containing protein [Clostridia bacterium]|nr:TIR domain-containing protein [Clostridia bacterium]
MSEQVFISYRRVGGDVTAKLICETLKGRGYTVFYDYDSINNGRFDTRIFAAIEDCTDFIVVLSEDALDNCVNQDDWVRWEIRHALKYNKNIVPVMVPEFKFPDNLPGDIADVAKFQGVKFVMDYFDSVMSSITSRLISQPAVTVSSHDQETKSNEPKGFLASLFGFGNKKPVPEPAPAPKPQPKSDASASNGLSFERFGDSYIVTGLGYCNDRYVVIPKIYCGLPVTSIGKLHSFGSSSIIYNRCSPKRIKIPNSVTEIGQEAFYGLNELESVNVPSSVNKIGKGAFMKGTYPVAEIIYDGTMEMWDAIRFAPEWIKLNYGNTLVHCVDGVIDLKQRENEQKRKK